MRLWMPNNKVARIAKDNRWDNYFSQNEQTPVARCAIISAKTVFGCSAIQNKSASAPHCRGQLVIQLERAAPQLSQFSRLERSSSVWGLYSGASEERKQVQEQELSKVQVQLSRFVKIMWVFICWSLYSVVCNYSRIRVFILALLITKLFLTTTR